MVTCGIIQFSVTAKPICLVRTVVALTGTTSLLTTLKLTCTRGVCGSEGVCKTGHMQGGVRQQRIIYDFTYFYDNSTPSKHFGGAQNIRVESSVQILII